MDMTYNEGDNQVELVVTTAGKRSLTCNDFFLIADIEIYHVEDFILEGAHKLNFKLATKNSKIDLSATGLQTYLFCESLQDELLSVITTVKAFAGGFGLHGNVPFFEPKVPAYMEKANKDFLHWSIGYDLVERPTRKIEFDESQI